MNKVIISIILDDSGNLKFSSSSKNLVTILGILDLARNGFLAGQVKKEESSILVPRFGENGA